MLRCDAGLQSTPVFMLTTSNLARRRAVERYVEG
jgi:hypothetical protein